jgi:hypothetical protein
VPRLFAEIAVHARQVPNTSDPRLRTGTAACPRTGADARIRSLATRPAQSGGAVRRTEEPNRTATLASAQNAVRTRAVLLGSHGAEPEAAGAVPQQ